MIIGYARVSTLDQSLEAQDRLLRDRGCEKVFGEKLSGSKRGRPELDRMLEELKEGDVVMVCKLDRLGRSLRDLIDLVTSFQEKKVGFKVVDGSVDTTTPQGMMVFHVMGAIAEFEREMARERTRDMLAYKKSIGVKLGRRLVIDKEKMGVLDGLRKGGKKREEIMEEMGITHYKYYQLVGRMGMVDVPVKSANHA